MKKDEFQFSKYNNQCEISTRQCVMLLFTMVT